MSMELSLRFDHVGSLKEKRRIIKSMIEKLKRRYNISIIESADHDDIKHANLTLVCVAHHRDKAEYILNKVIEFIETHFNVEIDFIDKEVL